MFERHGLESFNSQQHVHRAAAAIDLPCRAEGLNVIDSLQPLIDDVLEHRPAGSGAASLAVNDADAAHATSDRFGEELTHRGFRLGRRHAMQIDLSIDCEVTATQFQQHGFRDVGAAKAQLVARGQQGFVGRRQQAFLQHFPMIRPSEACARGWFGRRGRSPAGGIAQATHVAHRFPKGRVVMIPVVVHNSLQHPGARHAAAMKLRLGLQYSSAPPASKGQAIS